MPTTPPDLASTPPWSTARRCALGLLLVALTLAAYGPVFGAQFVYDDHLVVLRNPAVAQFDLGALLTRPLWAFYNSETELAVGYWRPASSVLLALTYALAGPAPLAFHMLVLALHLAACGAAWALARRITRSDGVGFCVALLFALHPVHVESIAWISAVGDPAFGLCALLALERHLAWREAGSRGSPWAAGALLLAGLAAKELAAGAIVAVVVLDLALGHRPRGWRAYVPYVAAFGAYCAARMWVFHSPWAGFDRTTTEFGVSAARLLLLRAEILGLGLRFAAWPTELRLFHPFAPDASRAGLALPLAALGVWVALCAWFAWRKERVMFAATALILAPLAVLVVRVGALGTFPFSERYLYLAVFGIALLAVVLARRFVPRPAALALFGVACIAAGVATHAQARTWRDDATLFRTAAERSPRAPYARWLHGRELLERYRATRDAVALHGAEREFTESLALLEAAQKGDGTIFGLSDDHVQSNVGLGWVLLYLADADGTHDFEPAEQVFRMASQRYPDSEEAWTGLGVARMERGDVAGAKTAFDQALKVNERFVEAHRNLGRLHMRTGDWAAARASFENALRWQPDGPDTLVLLGQALERGGDDGAARRTFDRAAELAPRDARPRVQRAILCAKSGLFDEALRELDAAIALDPNEAEAHLTRGKVLAARGENHAALAAFQRACELDTSSFEAHNNAGLLAVQLEGVPQAMPFLLRAYENRPDAAAAKRLGDAIRKLPIASPEAFLQLATSDADDGDVDGALAWLADSFELQPENGPAHFLQGAMLEKKGDKIGARTALEKAVKLMPDSFPAQDLLAGLLQELGDKAGALEHSEAALRILERSAAGTNAYDQPLDALRGRIRRLREGG
ncbi:MAG: tetratricopeptide repeat protein [Planctomycetota bacterium]|nr:tetratricopeptide repeat protein [Planctomycetota bacterium]